MIRSSLPVLFAAVVLAGTAIFQPGVHAQYQGAIPSGMPNQNAMAPPPLPFWRVRNTHIFMIPGAGVNGANVAVQVGRDGVAMVDTGSAELADKTVATVKFLQNYDASIPAPLGYAAVTRSSMSHTRPVPTAAPPGAPRESRPPASIRRRGASRARARVATGRLSGTTTRSQWTA